MVMNNRERSGFSTDKKNARFMFIVLRLREVRSKQAH